MDTGNPYQSPQSPVEVSPGPAPISKQMQMLIARNIRAICILYVVIGVIACVCGLRMFLSPKPRTMPVAACLLLVLGLASIISAVGVLRRRPWAVTFCQIMSGLYLLWFPFGTTLGGYLLLNVRKVIKKEGPAMPCPYCGFVNSAETRICPRCQTRLLTGGETTTCPHA